ncbi:hypothetical protein K461DRAFT_311424 [Myriangium duriaei CBS 260.36]|uniref:Uncharacterized protein n=1 Tax=Myriangium duriaei CBS 260.36 TaxID=1168546 RepID=A0A9P4J5D6_9PEZI|nr:hypothetical protein K461DRAFT_311424 [Myriangium duriaei CBS 260.36]
MRSVTWFYSLLISGFLSSGLARSLASNDTSAPLTGPWALGDTLLPAVISPGSLVVHIHNVGPDLGSSLSPRDFADTKPSLRPARFSLRSESAHAKRDSEPWRSWRFWETKTWQRIFKSSRSNVRAGFPIWHAIPAWKTMLPRVKLVELVELEFYNWGRLFQLMTWEDLPIELRQLAIGRQLSIHGGIDLGRTWWSRAQGTTSSSARSKLEASALEWLKEMDHFKREQRYIFNQEVINKAAALAEKRMTELQGKHLPIKGSSRSYFAARRMFMEGREMELALQKLAGDKPLAVSVPRRLRHLFHRPGVAPPTLAKPQMEPPPAPNAPGDPPAAPKPPVEPPPAPRPPVGPLPTVKAPVKPPVEPPSMEPPPVPKPPGDPVRLPAPEPAGTKKSSMPWRSWKFWKSKTWKRIFKCCSSNVRAGFPIWEGIPKYPRYSGVYRIRAVQEPGLAPFRKILRLMTWTEIPIEAKEMAISRQLMIHGGREMVAHWRDMALARRVNDVAIYLSMAEIYEKDIASVARKSARIFSEDVMQHADYLASSRMREMGFPKRGSKMTAATYNTAKRAFSEGREMELSIRRIFNPASGRMLEILVPGRLRHLVGPGLQPLPPTIPNPPAEPPPAPKPPVGPLPTVKPPVKPPVDPPVPKSPVEPVRPPTPDLGVKQAAEQAGRSISESVGEGLSRKLSAGIARLLGDQAASVVSRFMGRIGAKVGAILGKRIGMMTLRALISRVWGYANAALWIVDIIMTPLMIADLVTLLVPYKHGKCDLVKRVCISDRSHKKRRCSKHHPCEVDGEKCGYRSIHPHKVVCNWEKFDFFRRMTGMKPISMAMREHKASRNRKKAQEDQKAIDGWKIELKTCGGKTCGKLKKKIDKRTKKLKRHLMWADQYKHPKWAKKAKKKWDKAERYAKTDIVEARDNLEKSKLELKHATNSFYAKDKKREKKIEKARERIKKAEEEIDKRLKELEKKIKSAEKWSVKADPFTMAGEPRNGSMKADNDDQKVKYLEDQFHEVQKQDQSHETKRLDYTSRHKRAESKESSSGAKYWSTYHNTTNVPLQTLLYEELTRTMVGDTSLLSLLGENYTLPLANEESLWSMERPHKLATDEPDWPLILGGIVKIQSKRKPRLSVENQSEATLVPHGGQPWHRASAIRATVCWADDMRQFDDHALVDGWNLSRTSWEERMWA